ncbi:periplasmic serine protease, Do/DeqQ family [Bernardetia litoralis DSM 6794]|uniref:Periplasmic serine protease, Do/DeqQ family n=1 Tax=Bernardetia litoralis (strain ATCC 23117 / DSM 6794 / NBRC 15988 / NCIMB 1366 / Fx l1 / Sio-4) TaxID=880071 RepID=I4AIB3_BERLS|nr:Do family serine endopeptidase [Bernardetia litoralis]AFM03698.1 periplasmic serine protease, Do/DeqQ family [Bernardetia litoralis DSM 6794]
MKRIGLFFIALLSAIVGGGVALGVYLNFFTPQYRSENSLTNQPVLQTGFGNPDPISPTFSPQNISFVEAAKKATPAVVHIQTFGNPALMSNRQQNSMEDLFKDFFGQQPPNRNQNQNEVRMGSGSGVIIKKDGYIVTNNHVVENATRIDVVMNNQKSYTAKLIGTDPTTDLALLKIEADENLSSIPFGNSDALQVGEWVLAVGNPFDLTSTVTAGIVSAKARNINILRRRDGLGVESFIQTDAAVNPGNSGGALVNANGELVGINTAIASTTGSFAGYSFAVPTEIVRKVVTDLREHGIVQRGLLGVQIRDVTADLSKELNLSVVRGIYVAGVTENSGAIEAGLEKGDVIIEVDGVQVNTSAQLQERIARKRPGDKVEVVYLRNGKERNTNVELKNSLGTTKLITNEAGELMKIESLGIEVQNISPEMATKIGTTGVKVASITEGKFKEAQMPEGFVITHIDKQKIETSADVIRLLEGKTGGVLIEGFHPNGRKGFFAIAM